jgi:CubicO group peptidase (beta-lactamase class C family)
VLPQNDTIALNNLVEDLNRDVPAMRRQVAEKAITLLSDHDRCFFPLKKRRAKRLAYVGVGVGQENAFARMLKAYYGADLFSMRQGFQTKDSLLAFIDSLRGYTKLIVGIHQLNRAPANRFGMKDETLELIHHLQDSLRAMTFLFGNAYAAGYFPEAKNLAICYEDDSIVHQTAFDLLRGKLDYRGKLPVTIHQQFPLGTGLTTRMTALPDADQSLVHHLEEQLHEMDEKIELAILKKAMPGCSILAMQNGEVIFEKNYGFETYSANKPVDAGSIYDLASVTKILSTTLALMNLKETGKIKLSDHIGKHLPELKKTRKAKLTIRQLLMHEAGLTPYLPFYKETLDTTGLPSPEYYSNQSSAAFPIHVANNLYFSKIGLELFWNKYLESPQVKPGKYVYSDLGFILLGKIVERVSGKPLDVFVDSIFYRPMGLKRIGYLAAEKFPTTWIVPTATETGFRNQELRGWVHDPGAALMGGVAGHAGLFADARDIAAILQMLLQKGVWMGKAILKAETIQEFTNYQHAKSRRGLGFDKPEQHQAAEEPYPAKQAGPSVFGHLGFTGTGVWADPEKNRVVVFLSNRVYEENNVFQKMRLRAFVFDQLYEALDNLHP